MEVRGREKEVTGEGDSGKLTCLVVGEVEGVDMGEDEAVLVSKDGRMGVRGAMMVPWRSMDGLVGLSVATMGERVGDLSVAGDELKRGIVVA